MSRKQYGSHVPLMRPKNLVMNTPYQARCESCYTYLLGVRDTDVIISTKMVHTAASVAEAIPVCKHKLTPSEQSLGLTIIPPEFTDDPHLAIETKNEQWPHNANKNGTENDYGGPSSFRVDKIRGLPNWRRLEGVVFESSNFCRGSHCVCMKWSSEFLYDELEFFQTIEKVQALNKSQKTVPSNLRRQPCRCARCQCRGNLLRCDPVFVHLQLWQLLVGLVTPRACYKGLRGHCQGKSGDFFCGRFSHRVLLRTSLERAHVLVGCSDMRADPAGGVAWCLQADGESLCDCERAPILPE